MYLFIAGLVIGLVGGWAACKHRLQARQAVKDGLQQAANKVG